jgi:hypothetical protein
MAYRLRDVLLTVGSTSLFKIFFLFAAPLFRRFTHPPLPSVRKDTLLADGRGVSEEPNHVAAIKPMSILKRGGQILL